MRRPEERAALHRRPSTTIREKAMTEFSTYRVRFRDCRLFALNLSAPSPEQACELARQVRANIGQHVFEEFDGWIDEFEAEPLGTGPINADQPLGAPSALDFLKEQGGAS
jgi:hypothetical protein